ncbi:MAG: hypothetical protein EPO27_15935 [Betaproteobacteria bacterium]|nr:MAG: hypothetical protein EPO27_15935 [Betaproteobacteria bacterium]
MTIQVHWRYLKPSGDDGWRQIRCLYAYLAPRTREILYIGKAWGATVRERWRRTGKYAFWDDLEKERGIRAHYTLLGDIALPANERLTRELVADIESLLIQRVQPWGNIQCRSSRIPRPGMEVGCHGRWPLQRSQYIDRD